MPSTVQLNNSPRCQHVHYSGKPCKAPARRGRNYCIFHQAAHFDSGGCVLPIVEDLHSYQLAVIRIARALADDAIDSRKATALLYALQLAGSKLNQFCDERRDIEDPDAAEGRELLSRLISLRLRKAGKFPTPTEDELKEILAESGATTPDAPAYPEPAHNEGSQDDPEPEIITTVGPQDAPPDAKSNEPSSGCPTPTDPGRVGLPNSAPASDDPPKRSSRGEILMERLDLINPNDPRHAGKQPPQDCASDSPAPPEAA